MDEERRPDPNALLAGARRDERRRRRGRLKVFLGMSPGVGKTYAMLEAAMAELRAGRKVVVGYVESHGRAETDALLVGMPAIARRSMEHRGVAMAELDLDAVLARHPDLAIIDELAHTNAPGSRHPKRYQDVGELLDAGIDVFTTLNVQHVESRAETVREVTGAIVRETVPDSVLDDAELELIDLPPSELLERLRAGKVYVPDRASEAVRGFFREGNLTALRELALRLAAEKVSLEAEQWRGTQSGAGVWRTGQRLLVALSPSPLSEPMARWTRRLSDSLRAPWLAVYVDTGRGLSDEDQRRLQKNLTLARDLGAEVLTTSDSDVVSAILRLARQRNVTHIVAGKPAGSRFAALLPGGSLLGRLIRESGNIDILCVRAEGAEGAPAAAPFAPARAIASSARQYAAAGWVVAATTLLNLLLQRLTGEYTLSLIYLLAVVGLALFAGRGPVLLAATASALLWDFLFLPPTYTLYISRVQDGLMFGMFFVVALAMGQLTTRLRAQQMAERERERQATALYLLTRELAEGKDHAELLGVVVRQMGDVFRVDSAVLLPEPESEDGLVAYPFGTLAVSGKEFDVAVWAYRNGKAAGRSTDTLPAAESLFLPLNTSSGCIGVLGLRFKDGRTLSQGQRGLLESFVRQIALALDRQRLRDAEQGARLLAESERLGRTLLNSVSHELRTPLAVVTAAAGALRASAELSAAQSGLVGEIEVAVARLNRLVRNLLDLARLESGHLRPCLDWCDPADLCRASLASSGAVGSGRAVALDLPPEPPLVRTDFVLMEQVLSNLLSNALVHTPAGSAITVAVRAVGGFLEFSVLDTGPGIAPADLGRVFDRFYRSAAAHPGGTGLGLSIVKGFTEAVGGTVSVANRPEGGAAFTVRLPLVDVPKIPGEGA